MNKPAKVEVVFSINGHYFKLALDAADVPDFHADIKPWVAAAEEIDPPKEDLNGFETWARRKAAREILALGKLENNREYTEGLYIAARHLNPRIARTEG